MHWKRCVKTISRNEIPLHKIISDVLSFSQLGIHLYGNFICDILRH